MPAPEHILAPLIALAAAAGINLYATGFIAGGLGYLHWVPLPAGLQWLAHPPVLLICFVLFCLEFFADKIRFVDTVWDVIHTVVRPVGAVVIALGLTKSLPEWGVPLIMLAGATALATHTAKSSISLGLKATPPVGLNTLRSLLEDLFAGTLTWLALAHPIPAVIVVALLFLAMLLVARTLLGYVRSWFRTMRTTPV